MMLRSFDSALELRDDGREVYGRIVPFGVRAHVREVVDGHLDEYDEEFLPDCTAKIRQTAQRSRGGRPSWIGYKLEHRDEFDYRIGTCFALDEAADGVWASFRLADDPMRLDKIRSMLKESHDGFSIEFDDVAAPIVTGNLRQRTQIHIAAVAATPIPVYAGAGITAIRAADLLAPGPTPRLDAVRAMLAATAPASVESAPDDNR